VISTALLLSLLAVPGVKVTVPDLARDTEPPRIAMKKPGTVVAKEDLRLSMRKLWDDHVVYTRNYIISALADLPDAGAIAERLLSNQDEIGAALKPYYGEEAGNKLTALLRDHIKCATAVVGAAKAGDKMALDKAHADWGANAEALAAFLAGANKEWNKKELADMLHKHLELTTGELTSRLNKDWKADVDYYDKGHAHMLMFADVLTDGIVKQFPEKFSK
jgi:hypothetical protein